MKIKQMKATTDNFSVFGKLVTLPTAEPTAEGPTFRFWSDIADYTIEGETEIGLCTVYKQADDEVQVVERHLRTPELLIPVDAPFILPVAGPDGTVSAYRVDPGEAVVIDEAVWHGPCIPVGKQTCTYFVIFRKGTPFEDVEKRNVQKTTIED